MFSLHTHEPVRTRCCSRVRPLRRGAERHRRQHRTKNLLLRHDRRRMHVAQQCWWEKQTTSTASATLAASRSRLPPSPAPPVSECGPVAHGPRSRRCRSPYPAASPCAACSCRSRILAISGSAMLSCISSRDPAQHTCPWLNQIPSTSPSTTLSRSASSKMMNGDSRPAPATAACDSLRSRSEWRAPLRSIQ